MRYQPVLCSAKRKKKARQRIGIRRQALKTDSINQSLRGFVGRSDIADVHANGTVTADVTANLVAAIDVVNAVAAGGRRVMARDGREGVALIQLRDHPSDVRQLLDHLITNRGQPDNHADHKDRCDQRKLCRYDKTSLITP
jgi:hypothetical protein